MTKLQITKILSETKYRLPVSPVDKAVYAVDVDKAADKILGLIPDIESVYKQWCQETGRSGGVLVGKSIREFFTYYNSL